MTDRMLGAACVLMAAAMGWFAQDYAAAISYEPVGPRAFPRLLAGLLAIGGAWLVLRPTMADGIWSTTPLKLIGFCLLAVFVYAALFEVLGFALATALMAVPIGMAFGGGWKQSLIGGAGMGVGMYLLFDKVLDVVLPTGLLALIFGGR